MSIWRRHSVHLGNTAKEMNPAAHRLYIVDVFAARPYAGNPLAVIVTAGGLSDDTLQRIAAEMNHSETTFVAPAPEADGGYRVRIFTPSREIPFAGHPVLGTAWVVRHHVALEVSGSVRLNVQARQLVVTFEPVAGAGDVAWFVVPPIAFEAHVAPERMAAAVGLSAQDISADAPIQRLSGGATAVIVPLRSLEALRRCRLDLQAFAPLAADGFPPLVYLFCSETRDAGNQLSARFFFDAHGVREDPATGFGAGLLGAYLLEHRLFPGPSLSLRIEQGHEVRRPSVVMLRARRANGSHEVSVGGPVIPVVQGELVSER
jgi:trans-2,3-dihydro-3-hydroxyanthranilate isomerase